MAGQGIFENISSLSLTDPFGIAVDLVFQILGPQMHLIHLALPLNLCPCSTYQCTKGQINLRLKSSSDLDVVEIIDLTGKKLFESKLESNLLNHRIQIPNFIKNGIYPMKTTDQTVYYLGNSATVDTCLMHWF